MYITQQDYIDAYGREELIQLTDFNNIGIIEDSVFDRHLSGTESFVNSRLNGLYVIPLTLVNDDIKDILLSILRARLYTLNESEEVTKNHDQAISRFKDYIDGIAIIDGAEKPVITLQASSKKGSDAVFTDDLFLTHY